MVVQTSPAKVHRTNGEFSGLNDFLHLLVDGDFQERWEATKHLTNCGKAAIAPLMPLMQDSDLDWEIRWFAARTLGQIDHPDALAALVTLLQQTDDAELIAIAAQGIAQFGDKGVEALAQVFYRTCHRLTAVQALGNIHHESVLEPLFLAAQDDAAPVRRAAIAALGNFHHPKIDEILVERLRDSHVAVRKEAISQLSFRRHLLTQVNLVEILLPGLWDISLEVNQATAIALGRLGSETAIASLSRVLASPHTPEQLQATILQALGWIEKETSLLALLSARQNLSPKLQVELIETLTRFRTDQLRERAGEALCTWLKAELRDDPVASQVAWAIALALGNLQYEPALPLLESVAATAKEHLQLYTNAALRQLLDATQSLESGDAQMADDQ